MSEDQPVLELSGQDGNAFAILGRAQRVFRKAGIPAAEIEAMMNEAQSGDYDNLLATVIEFADKHNIEVQ
jgi:hypothetical protein